MTLLTIEESSARISGLIDRLVFMELATLHAKAVYIRHCETVAVPLASNKLPGTGRVHLQVTLRSQSLSASSCAHVSPGSCISRSRVPVRAEQTGTWNTAKLVKAESSTVRVVSVVRAAAGALETQISRVVDTARAVSGLSLVL